MLKLLRSRRESWWCVLALVMLSTGAAAQERAPHAAALVSPGAPERFSPISSSCPTFSWDPVAGATSHELAVFLVGPDATSSDPGTDDLVVREVLARSLPGTASSWTPDLADCLAPGARYAWAVRAVGDGWEAVWSEPRRFETPAFRPGDELDRALEIVRRHLPELEASVQRGESAARSSEPDAPPVDGNERRVARSHAGPTLLDVAGNVNATSFSGDGTDLTEVTAVAGDSATGFFTTGQIEAERISDAIARDSEIPSLEVGDISGVTAGTGLTGGASAGVATLGADTAYLQRRVSAGCPGGSSIRQVGTDGSVTCENDSGQGSFSKSISATACTSQGTFGSGDLDNCSSGGTLRTDGSTNFPCVIRAGTSLRTYVCELDLPVGTKIEHITAHGFDNSSTGYVEASVWRMTPMSGLPNYISSFGGTWQNSGVAATPLYFEFDVFPAADLPHTVAAGYRYVVGFATIAPSGYLFFGGIEVDYTVP